MAKSLQKNVSVTYMLHTFTFIACFPYFIKSCKVLTFCWKLPYNETDAFINKSMYIEEIIAPSFQFVLTFVDKLQCKISIWRREYCCFSLFSFLEEWRLMRSPCCLPVSPFNFDTAPADWFWRNLKWILWHYTQSKPLLHNFHQLVISWQKLKLARWDWH